MGRKGPYKTKQRDELLAFLKTVPGQHITARDVCQHLKQQGTPIGTATVYRQLEKLVDEGLVTKYVTDSNSPACFEYVGEHRHTPGKAFCHCKCQQCGRLIHLYCDELPGMQQHIWEHHGFAIDPIRTIFYGMCAQCAGLV